MSKLIRLSIWVIGVVIILFTGFTLWYIATLYPAGQPQTGYLALTGGNFLVGENLEPYNSVTVLIHDGIIINIGDDDVVEIPSDARVMDLSGYTVIPGLIDLHIHLGSPVIEPDKEPGLLMFPKLIAGWIRYFPARRRAFLQNGVTTIRSLGDDYNWISDVRNKLSDGSLEGPRLYAAGPVFTTPGGHPVVTFGIDPESGLVRIPTTAAEARAYVLELAEGTYQADTIKLVQERGSTDNSLEPFSSEILHAIVDEAHKNNLTVTAHWGTMEDLEDVLAANVDALEHLEAQELLTGWPTQILEKLAERNISITPTLAVTEAAFPSDIYEQFWKRAGEFHEAGGTLVVGSDAPMHGIGFGDGVHRELELLVKSGLSPREALIAATSKAARILRAEHLGAIETGRSADLLVITGNPLENISDIRNVVNVFREGRLVYNKNDY